MTDYGQQEAANLHIWRDLNDWQPHIFDWSD